VLHSELPRRGILVARDGTIHEVPDYALDETEIGWPLTMPKVQSGQPTPLMESYRRHEIHPGRYIYTLESIARSEIPEEVITNFLNRAG
jgi:hypothetical protein